MTEKPAVSPKYKSQEDYLVAERQNPVRSEFVNGRVMGRSGSSRWQNLVVSNVAIAVGSRIHGSKTEIYIGNMKVRLKNNFIVYPDVIFVNGEPSFADQNADVLLNPTVVVEVISNQTNSVDKTQKLESFLALDSIRECLLIKQDEMRIEHYAKQNAKQWIYKIYNERDDVVSMEAINCKISLSEIYGQVKFAHAQLSSSAVN